MAAKGTGCLTDAPHVAMMTRPVAGRGSEGRAAPGPFGALPSGFIDPTGFPSTYEGVKIPDDVALGLALVVRSLARGRR